MVRPGPGLAARAEGRTDDRAEPPGAQHQAERRQNRRCRARQALAAEQHLRGSEIRRPMAIVRQPSTSDPPQRDHQAPSPCQGSQMRLTHGPINRLMCDLKTRSWRLGPDGRPDPVGHRRTPPGSVHGTRCRPMSRRSHAGAEPDRPQTLDRNRPSNPGSSGTAPQTSQRLADLIHDFTQDPIRVSCETREA